MLTLLDHQTGQTKGALKYGSRWSWCWIFAETLVLLFIIPCTTHVEGARTYRSHDYDSEEESYASNSSAYYLDNRDRDGERYYDRLCHITEPQPRTTGLVFTYDLVVEWGNAVPDGFNQKAILINGQFPGPELVVHPYSTLVLNVHNKLDKGFTLHMHGIYQEGTISSDGVPHVTQYEIPPCGFYKYVTFIGKQHGTFMYHAHTGYDATWAFGALILKDPVEVQTYLAYQYEYEKTIIISQCWHEFFMDIANGVTGTPFQDIPDTASLLVNGKSWGQWPSSSTNRAGSRGSGYEVIRVEPNKKYRLRVIGFGIDSMVSFSIRGHKMRVIEADGILISPFTVSHLQINIAQRYSVIIETNQAVDNYEIVTEMVPGPGPRNGFAILHYKGAPPTGRLQHELREGETREREIVQWPISKVYPSPFVYQASVYPIPTLVDREIVIKTQETNQPDGHVYFEINGVHTTDDVVPLLLQLRTGVIPANMEPKVFQIKKGQVIQLVFQNAYSSENECEQHPWHMHGHSFYVVGHGPNAYDKNVHTEVIEYNVRSGRLPLRDVATLYPDQSPPNSNNATGTPCGWLAIRFVANNPGFWLVHCHLVAHQLMGKKFTFYEHSDEDKLLTGSI